jgi:N-acetylmuramoyl-L-alanine amidase
MAAVPRHPDLGKAAALPYQLRDESEKAGDPTFVRLLSALFINSSNVLTSSFWLESLRRAVLTARRMKAMIAFLLLLAGGLASAQGAAKGLERVWVGATEYVRLEDWAEASGFKMKWPGKDQPIEVRGGAARLVFAADSRKLSIDGVTVWLSLPVVNRNAAALVSLLDVETTLEPILFPRKSGKPLETICLDPGHGGKDGGEKDNNNLEKTYTLLLARELAGLLRTSGFRVVLTRESDETVELAGRAEMARRNGADLFASLHYNSAATPVRGVEVYCLTPAGANSSQDGGGKGDHPAEQGNTQDGRNVLLAWQVQKAITRSLPLEDRGLKRARYEVLREARMPAILIEGGFMTDPTDARRIYDSKFRKRMAEAIVEGINAYKEALEGNEKL